MRAFITGIAGFAGVHLTEHLIACGDAVAGSSLSGRWSTGPEIPEGIREMVPQMAWDISQPTTAAVQSQVADFAPDVIYHLAAISKAADCGEDEPTPLAQAVNIEGTQRVLELAAAIPSRPRVIVLSSSYVYGPSQSAGDVVPENRPTALIGGYAKSKLASETFALSMVHHGQVDALIVRAFQHAGPRQEPRFMLAQWCQQFAAGDTPIVVRSWNSFIDLSDVRDVVRAYRLLAQRGETGQIYNVGSGVCQCSGDIFERLRAMCDPQRPFTADPHAPPRYSPIADIRRVQALTGWRPEIPLEQTMQDTYAWFRNLR